MPTKTAFAGANACQVNYQNTNRRRVYVLKHTEPTASPKVAENAKRTLTIGSSHLVNLSSLFCDRWGPWTCCRSTTRMALGDSHGSSCSAIGCVRRSFFVRFLYMFKASSKISWKFVDAAALGCVSDMRVGARCCSRAGKTIIGSWVAVITGLWVTRNQLPGAGGLPRTCRIGHTTMISAQRTAHHSHQQ